MLLMRHDNRFCNWKKERYKRKIQQVFSNSPESSPPATFRPRPWNPRVISSWNTASCTGTRSARTSSFPLSIRLLPSWIGRVSSLIKRAISDGPQAIFSVTLFRSPPRVLRRGHRQSDSVEPNGERATEEPHEASRALPLQSPEVRAQER